MRRIYSRISIVLIDKYLLLLCANLICLCEFLCFCFQLIYVKNTTPSFTTAMKGRSVSAENQVTRIRANLTTAIESHDNADQRYNAFRTVIERIGRNCKKVAFNSIIDRANVTNANDIKATVTDFYVKHVKNYATQSRQAILERKETQPIVQGAAIAVRAMCQQMLSMARNKIRASKHT